MGFMCRPLICSWLVAYWWNEYRRTKRDQVKTQGQMEVASSEPRSNGINQLAPFSSHKEATCNSSW
jgi:hypothetical protein